MKKRILLALFLCLPAVPRAFAAAQFKAGTHALVDGVYNSTQAVITSRNPLFSWEYSNGVSSFTITVSTDSLFQPSGELWNYTGSTTTVNTINYITRVEYNADNKGTALAADRTYYWQVTIYDGDSASDGGQFTTTTAAAALPAEKYDLAIDWNNPFDPSKNQITKFRFTAKDRDRKMKLRVFTLSGELVREWPEQTVIQGAVYTEIWDGKNGNNDTVARGVYLINLMDVGEKTGITKKVAVINGN